jgi:hypothetical protein
MLLDHDGMDGAEVALRQTDDKADLESLRQNREVRESSGRGKSALEFQLSISVGSGLGQGRTGQEFDEPIVVGCWPNRVVAWNPCAAKIIPL